MQIGGEEVCAQCGGRGILAAETGVPNPMTFLRHFHERAPRWFTGPRHKTVPPLHARETQEDSDYRWRLFAQRRTLLAAEGLQDLDICAGNEQDTSLRRNSAIRFIVEGSTHGMDSKSAGTNLAPSHILHSEIRCDRTCFNQISRSHLKIILHRLHSFMYQLSIDLKWIMWDS